MKYVRRGVMVMMGLLLLAGCGKKASGRIEIRSDKPDAKIFIDDKRVGNTPSDKFGSFGISVEEGEHTVRCLKGDKEGTKNVFVAAKSMQTVKVTLDQLTKEAKIAKEKREREERIAREKREREEKIAREKLLKDIYSQLVSIPAGSFMMGSPSSEEGRWKGEVQHQVTLTQSFKMGKYEVTQKQYQAVMGGNPSYYKGENLPVETVSWHAAMKFCSKLTEWSRKAGVIGANEKYTLPTEAQWEYACRAGTTGAYAGDLDAMAWYDSNSGEKTHEVGEKQSNAWGLYDMHGNVQEWCRDWKDDYPTGACSDPTGPASGSARVNRGASWYYGGLRCRSANRNSSAPGSSNYLLGFRMVLVQ